MEILKTTDGLAQRSKHCSKWMPQRKIQHKSEGMQEYLNTYLSCLHIYKAPYSKSD